MLHDQMSGVGRPSQARHITNLGTAEIYGVALATIHRLEKYMDNR
jgi:hypothetical protein